MAKAGEIVEIVAAWACADGSTDNERTGIASVAAMLGELRLLGDDLSEAARTED